MRDEIIFAIARAFFERTDNRKIDVRALKFDDHLFELSDARFETRDMRLRRCLMFGVTPTSSPGRSIPRYYRCSGKDCTSSAREHRCPQRMTPAESRWTS